MCPVAPPHVPLLTLLAALVMSTATGCSKPESSTSTPPPASSSTMPGLAQFSGLGVTFAFPVSYQTHVAADDPHSHQVAVDARRGSAGVLTIRLDSTDPSAPVDLQSVAERGKVGRGDGQDAALGQATLKVGRQTYDARSLKYTIMGFPFTDTMAVVVLGGRTYTITTHSADEDRDIASTMFDTVLSTLSPL